MDYEEMLDVHATEFISQTMVELASQVKHARCKVCGGTHRAAVLAEQPQAFKLGSLGQPHSIVGQPHSNVGLSRTCHSLAWRPCTGHALTVWNQGRCTVLASTAALQLLHCMLYPGLQVHWCSGEGNQCWLTQPPTETDIIDRIVPYCFAGGPAARHE